MEHFWYQVHDWQSLLNELKLGIQLHPQRLACCLTHGRQKFILQAKILTWGVSFLLYKIRWFDSRISAVLLGYDAPRGPPAVASGIGCCNCLRFCVETPLCLPWEAWSRRPCQGWKAPLWQPPSPAMGPSLWEEGSMCFMACFANVRIKGFPGVNGGHSAESPEWHNLVLGCVGAIAFLGSANSSFPFTFRLEGTWWAEAKFPKD